LELRQKETPTTHCIRRRRLSQRLGQRLELRQFETPTTHCIRRRRLGQRLGQIVVKHCRKYP
jgi:hypothetical protein